MFKIGDKVVYPMHGAGVIEDIEELTIDGNKKYYYVILIPVNNLKIQVSVAKAEEIGVRIVSNSDKVIDILKTCKEINMSDNWNQRYKDNIELIKTGDLKKIVEVFKTLISREKIKSLSSAEKKLLVNAKQIILSEIIVSQNLEREQAEELLVKTTY